MSIHGAAVAVESGEWRAKSAEAISPQPSNSSPLSTLHSPLFAEVEGGVTAPLGFSAAGLYCGIRKVKKDIALIKSEIPADVAAVFTLNKTIAAPLIVDKELLARGKKKCSAIVVNSGNANACTGERGMQDAWAMAVATATALSIPLEEVLI